MKLSKRLELVLSFVNPAETAADIGTDHAYVPIELVRRQIVRRAVAADVRKGPLWRAEESIAAAGLGYAVHTRLSDGLAGFSAGEAEAVVIAGMGGELILHIMEQGRHMWDTVAQWILSPQSELYKVRKWLSDNGFLIEKEGMVSEDGKYYTVMSVVRADAAHRSCEAGYGGCESREVCRDAGCESCEACRPAGYGGRDVCRNAGCEGRAACRPAGRESCEACRPVGCLNHEPDGDGMRTDDLRRREEEFYYGRYLIETGDPVLLAYLCEEREALGRLKETLEKQAQGSKRARERLLAVEEMLCYNQEVEDEMLRYHGTA